MKTEEDPKDSTELVRIGSVWTHAGATSQRRSRELALLIQASKTFNSSLDLNQVFTTILEEVRSLMGVVASSIWLVDVQTDELVCQHASGPSSEKIVGWRLSPGQGIAGWTARYGESMVVPDTRADVRYFRGVEQQTELPLRSILSVPLKLRENTIGVLQVVDRAIGRFHAADLALMESLADSAAIAIENARLYAGARQEIRERQKTERRLRESQQLLQRTLNSLHDAVFVIDADTTYILDCNPAASEIFGYDRDEMVGKPMTFLYTDEAELGDFRGLLPAATDEQGFLHQLKFHMRRKNGAVFPVEHSVTPLEKGGDQRIGWVTVVRDVTERNRIEAVQAQAEEQTRLAAIGRLAAGVAHDFNNIISVIALYARMSLHTPGLPGSVYERLQTIDQQAWSAEELIQQILDFSRHAALERQPIDLLIFLKELTRMLRRTLPENIQTDLSYDEDEYIVNANPTRVQQAVLNLVVNARDAMPEGGKLLIALDRVQTNGHPKTDTSGSQTTDEYRLPPDTGAGEWVRLAVTDTGNGIPPDVLPHIFDPFFTTKGPGKGTGLGLSQVYDIVRAHDGHVGVVTRTGEGTRFTLYLPALASRQSISPPQDTGRLTQGRGQTIMVVEDDDPMRRALVESLESLNYRVLEAVNGQEALELFERRHSSGPEHDITLVLSDLVMPEMGGRTLLQVLKERDPTVKVVMMSGHPLEKELEDLHAYGVIEWLPKPPRLERLAEVLAQALA